LNKLLKETSEDGPEQDLSEPKTEFLYENSKKLTNPHSSQPASHNESEENPEYLEGLYGKPNIGSKRQQAKDPPEVSQNRSAFDIGEQIEQMEA
jgi:hypothetical protein